MTATTATRRTPAALGAAAAPLAAMLALAPFAIAQNVPELPLQQVAQPERAAQFEQEGVDLDQAETEPDVATSAEDLARLVSELSSDDFQAREAATARLCVAALTPEDILRALPPDESLSLEARSRLQTVLVDRFQRTPRAGLGASFGAVVSGPGVVLNLVVPDFPARDFLQAGDLITDVDGESLTQENGSDILRAAILSRDPGEALPLTVVREGRRSQIRVPLGSYADLKNSQTLSREVLELAWEMRLKRLGLARPQEQRPIVIQGVAWPQQQVRSRSPGAVTVVTGGDSTSVSDLDRMRRRTMVASGAQVRNAQVVVERRQPPVSPQQALRAQVNRFRNDAEKWRLYLKENADLAPEIRAKAERKLAEADARADAFEAELKTLQGQKP